MAWYKEGVSRPRRTARQRTGRQAGTMTTEGRDPNPAPDAEMCWQTLERAAASPALKRAARLREFLLYIGEQSVRLGRAELHEQELGETVFARPRGYDTTQDNIVRVSATELRKRLDLHFSAGGKDEPVIFEIPRGGYVPVFRWREQPVAATPEVEASNPIRPVRTGWERRLLWTVSAIALVLAVVCLLLWSENRKLERRIPAAEPPAALAR